MGLLEAALDHVSVKWAVLWLFGSFVVYLAVSRTVEEIKIRRLGTHGPAMRSHLPFGEQAPSRSRYQRQTVAHTRAYASTAGLDLIYRTVRATMAHKNFDLWKSHFERTKSYTVEGRILTLRVVLTADPENIKALLATQFSDYGKGEPFHREWEPFLGDSIFATDGDKWHASRQLLRPQFIKDRVSDLHCFETHIQTLFRCIANGGALNGEDQPVDMSAVNGRRLDISDLFFRYSLDVATDFLLGKEAKSMT